MIDRVPTDVNNTERFTIVHGDCLTELKALSDQSIDLIVTSPQYNIGIFYDGDDDRRPMPDYLAELKAVSVEMFRVLKEDGSLFLNVGSTNVEPWIDHDVAQVFRSVFSLQNRIIWVKSISIGETTVGHFKPINSQRFLNHIHETIFHFTKYGDCPIDRLAIGVPFKDKSNITRRDHKQDLRCAGNVWFLPYETVQSKAEKFHHPAGFPLQLPLRCIKLHGKQTGVVLDPYLGSGTTLVAAAHLGWSGIGIEQSEKYVTVSRNRLQSVMSHLASVQHLDKT